MREQLFCPVFLTPDSLTPALSRREREFFSNLLISPGRIPRSLLRAIRLNGFDTPPLAAGSFIEALLAALERGRELSMLTTDFSVLALHRPF